ncbi:hypothetical protein DYY66_0461 [Candidatus Nitrosotalea sp. FS]|nr:hypothetical protein [Candidatus Nitrosotalea sp. FS]
MSDMTGLAMVGTDPKSTEASNADVYPIVAVLSIFLISVQVCCIFEYNAISYYLTLTDYDSQAMKKS